MHGARRSIYVCGIVKMCVVHYELGGPGCMVTQGKFPL